MARFVKVRLACALALTAVLAACSPLNLGTAAKLRALDYLNDDIAALLLAFDVPLTLEPVPDGSVVTLDMVSPGNGERRLRAVLVRSEAGELAGRLPAPAVDRTYYLFGFSSADREAIREAQAWARTLPQTQPHANSLAIGITPRFCRTAAIDPRQVRVSVLVALPGTAALAPLLDGASLASLPGNGGGQLPLCAGHSG